MRVHLQYMSGPQTVTRSMARQRIIQLAGEKGWNPIFKQCMGCHSWQWYDQMPKSRWFKPETLENVIKDVKETYRSLAGKSWLFPRVIDEWCPKCAEKKLFGDEANFGTLQGYLPRFQNPRRKVICDEMLKIMAQPIIFRRFSHETLEQVLELDRTTLLPKLFNCLWRRLENVQTEGIPDWFRINKKDLMREFFGVAE